ncbi:hypothetical protein K9K85_02405 [Patescibacteria group bacterium]|nr:hypothetical protein [Patescibacteria group bacterium]
MKNFFKFTNLTKEKILILLIASLVFIPWPGKASSFRPDYIISDYELTNFQSMSQEEIQNFLESSGGGIKNYQTQDIDGREKTASEIIYRVTQEYQINPQVILTLLQKEKGLITKTNPSLDDYNWATGFACYDHRGPVKSFRGFAIQVDRAAWRLKYFLEHPWEFTYRSGQVYRISWQRVVPQNSATAALYNYTPHIAGNRLFWILWHNWFPPEQGQIEEGSLVRTNNENGVWLIQNNKKRPFHSATIFLLNHKFEEVKIVDPKILEKYEIGSPVNFPNYSLVQNKEEIFLLIDGQKRPISEKMFRAIGFNPEEIIQVEEKDLLSYQEGARISSPYPNGALLQDKENKGVYYVKDIIKRPIVDLSILENNFPYNNIIKVDSEELERYQTGEHLKFRDGSLLKTSESPAVYVISQGQYRPILSEKTFEALGYQWESIIEVSPEILNIHSAGEMIKI